MFQAILYLACYIVIERLIQDKPFSKNMIVTSQFVTPINGNHKTENVTKYPAKRKFHWNEQIPEVIVIVFDHVISRLNSLSCLNTLHDRLNQPNI